MAYNEPEPWPGVLPPDSLSKKYLDTFYAASRAALEVNREARRADLPTLAEPNAAANAVDYAKFYSRSQT